MNKHVSKTFGIIFLLLEIAVIPKAIELMLGQKFSAMSPVGIIVLSMTFSSIGLCILMSFSSMSEHDSYPLPTFLFELMVFLCCTAPVTDLASRTLDSSGKVGFNMLVNTIYYLVGISIAYLIMRYEFLIIGADNDPRLKNRKRIMSVLFILYIPVVILNVRFGYFFTIGQDGTYHSAPTFWIAYLVPLVIIAATVYTAAKEMSPGRERNTFMFYWVFAIGASLLQWLQSEFALQYTGYTFTMVAIYVNIQSELDTILMRSSEGEMN